MSEYIPIELKRWVKKKANGCCEYCIALSDFSFHPFAIDHILPVSKGGKTRKNNLALTCQHCNNTKYNKHEALDPLTNSMVSLFHPRQQKWSAHFIWNSHHTVVIGISPTGRATVKALKINRIEAVNLRKALAAYGVHPPKTLGT